MLVDAHTHLHEFGKDEIRGFGEIILVAVSDDVDSSRRVIELSEEFSNVTPCVGIHPWNVDKVPLSDVKAIEELVKRHEVKCIGEVGLDLRFRPETIERQRVYFSEFLRIAREYDAVINLHSPDAWRIVFDEVVKADLDKAIFHWYTGPLDLLDEIVKQGYYISINAAIKIQEKSRRVAERTPLGSMLTESDGPYEYRGIRLTPPMVKDAVSEIAKVKSIDAESIEDAVYFNYRKLFS